MIMYRGENARRKCKEKMQGEKAREEQIEEKCSRGKVCRKFY